MLPVSPATAGEVTVADPSTPSESGVASPAISAAESDLSGDAVTAPPDRPLATSGVTKQYDRNEKPNQAREAGRKGLVRPYGWLLKRIKKAVPGDVVKVQLLQHAGDLWTYDVTVLSESGRYVKISLNASTGVIISKKRQ